MGFPKLKAINLQTDRTPAVKAINFQIDSKSLAVKSINLQTDDVGVTGFVVFRSATAIKSLSVF